MPCTAQSQGWGEGVSLLSALSCVNFKQLHRFAEQDEKSILGREINPQLNRLSIMQTCVARREKGSSSSRLSSGAFNGIRVSKSIMGGVSIPSEHAFWGQHSESTVATVCHWPFTFVWTARNIFLKNHVKCGAIVLATTAFLKHYSSSIFNRLPKQTKMVWQCLLHPDISFAITNFTNIAHLLVYKSSLHYIVCNQIF